MTHNNPHQFNHPDLYRGTRFNSKPYRYTISEGDEYFDIDIDNYFEQSLYHIKEYTPEDFKQLVLNIVERGFFNIRTIIEKLCIEHGFFTIQESVCVHLGDGRINYNKDTIVITNPDPADII